MSVHLRLHLSCKTNSNVGFRFQLDSAVNLQDVVDRCPARMTGADLYALCSDAMTAAIKRKISLISDGKNTGSADVFI